MEAADEERAHPALSGIDNNEDVIHRKEVVSITVENSDSSSGRTVTILKGDLEQDPATDPDDEKDNWTEQSDESGETDSQVKPTDMMACSSSDRELKSTSRSILNRAEDLQVNLDWSQRRGQAHRHVLVRRREWRSASMGNAGGAGGSRKKIRSSFPIWKNRRGGGAHRPLYPPGGFKSGQRNSTG